MDIVVFSGSEKPIIVNSSTFESKLNKTSL
ncbi:hypothetical protein ELBR111191_10520 [Elizabethkingia bruuniana]